MNTQKLNGICGLVGGTSDNQNMQKMRKRKTHR